MRDEYDPQGRRWMVLFDPERSEAWLRVRYLEDGDVPPDFSDPATWKHLRREGSDGRRSTDRFRIK